jgi:hypothetical protein
MNLHPEMSMGLRPNQPSLSPGLNFNSPANSQRARLSPQIGEEILRSTSTENSLTNDVNGTLRPKLSLPSFLSSPSRLLQQLPASPASLLLSPLMRKIDAQQSSDAASFFPNNDDETNLVEQMDHYFIRRRQYLQHNIDVSLNMSRWVLENVVFYSVETLRYVLQLIIPPIEHIHFQSAICTITGHVF